MAMIDVVRFGGLKSRDWLIFKHPSEKLVLGTQLIVQEGQVAIFVKGGVVADVFGPGTYTLNTNNLPILQRLVNLPFGGDTPFSAEIYFVNLTTKLDLGWGTSDPIQLIDPKFYVKLRVRAYGNMVLRIQDVVVMFREIVGGLDNGDWVIYDKIKEYFRGIVVQKVKSAIGEEIISNGYSALDLSIKLESLSEQVKERISPEFEKYGFAVGNFFIQSINIPDEDFAGINEILKDKAAFEIMGDNRYATKRSFDVYQGAATNQNGVAGAFAAGGMGMGAAMSMGAAMGRTMGNPMQNTNMIECPNCRAQLPQGVRFCSQCGFSFAEQVCECGTKLTPGAKFCPQCGKRL
ncbi:MAG: SPFH domain-containing protein [Lachnospiraceae bacterium]|nr:SPFH domain-containing protein [Lachnospiraceae bacterium]